MVRLEGLEPPSTVSKTATLSIKLQALLPLNFTTRGKISRVRVARNAEGIPMDFSFTNKSQHAPFQGR